MASQNSIAIVAGLSRHTEKDSRRKIALECDVLACKGAVYAALVLAQRAGADALTDKLSDAYADALELARRTRGEL